MCEWRSIKNDPPELGQKVIVAAWEAGCKPLVFIGYCWFSSDTNQPIKLYLDETYLSDTPMQIGEVARLWMPTPEIKEQIDLF